MIQYSHSVYTEAVMKKKFLKVLAILGCLALGAGVAACGGKGNGGNSSGSSSQPEVSSPVEDSSSEVIEGSSSEEIVDSSSEETSSSVEDSSSEEVSSSVEDSSPEEYPEDYYTEGLAFMLLGDNTYAVSGYEGTATKVIIPAVYNNLPVTRIGGYVFEDCLSLTEIVIPDSVTRINEGAFSGCPSLTKISVNENNTAYKSIDGNLYSKDGKTLIQYASGKTEIVIPDSVTSIGDGALECYEGLTNITVEENNAVYKSIDGNLYSKDGKTLIQYAIGKTATAFTIPDCVTYIGDYAFCDSKSLTEIVIPDGVTSIGDGAFSSCENLTRVTFSGNSQLTSIGYEVFWECICLLEIVIPESVTIIGGEAFAYCSSLTIYCEAESKPSGWGDSWNGSNCPVVWGYKGE